MQLNAVSRSKVDDLDKELAKIRPNLQSTGKKKQPAALGSKLSTLAPADVDSAVKNIASLSSSI